MAAEPPNDAAPSAGPPVTDTSSRQVRGARILAVNERSPFFLITLLFVFVTILFKQPAVHLTLLGILLVFMVLVYIQSRNRAFLPTFVARYANRIIDRVKSFPIELILLLGIVYISVMGVLPEQYRPSPQASELIKVILVVLAFAMSRAGYRRSGLGWKEQLQQVFQRKPKATSASPAPEAAAPSTAAAVEEPAEPTAEREGDAQWQEQQQQRWEGWIDDEMTRLDGEDRTEH